jgi:hypothetical protein
VGPIVLPGMDQLRSSEATPSLHHQSFSAAERARLGIADDLLRLPVGFEDPAAIIADLDRALAVASAPGNRAVGPIDGCVLTSDASD